MRKKINLVPIMIFMGTVWGSISAAEAGLKSVLEGLRDQMLGVKSLDQEEPYAKNDFLGDLRQLSGEELASRLNVEMYNVIAGLNKSGFIVKILKEKDPDKLHGILKKHPAIGQFFRASHLPKVKKSTFQNRLNKESELMEEEAEKIQMTFDSRFEKDNQKVQDDLEKQKENLENRLRRRKDTHKNKGEKKTPVDVRRQTNAIENDLFEDL